MPIPKKYEDLYGRIVGRLQNIGYSHEEAKVKADKALRDRIKELKEKKKHRKGGKS